MEGTRYGDGRGRRVQGCGSGAGSWREWAAGCFECEVGCESSSSLPRERRVASTDRPALLVSLRLLFLVICRFLHPRPKEDPSMLSETSFPRSLRMCVFFLPFVPPPSLPLLFFAASLLSLLPQSRRTDPLIFHFLLNRLKAIVPRWRSRSRRRRGTRSALFPSFFPPPPLQLDLKLTLSLSSFPLLFPIQRAAGQAYGF